MIDNHDRCERVNVSSGTGSPGLSRQNLESRKMVVCVCGAYDNCLFIFNFSHLVEDFLSNY